MTNFRFCPSPFWLNRLNADSGADSSSPTPTPTPRIFCLLCDVRSQRRSQHLSHHRSQRQSTARRPLPALRQALLQRHRQGRRGGSGGRYGSGGGKGFGGGDSSGSGGSGHGDGGDGHGEGQAERFVGVCRTRPRDGASGGGGGSYGGGGGKGCGGGDGAAPGAAHAGGNAAVVAANAAVGVSEGLPEFATHQRGCLHEASDEGLGKLRAALPAFAARRLGVLAFIEGLTLRFGIERGPLGICNTSTIHITSRPSGIEHKLFAFAAHQFCRCERRFSDERPSGMVRAARIKQGIDPSESRARVSDEGYRVTERGLPLNLQQISFRLFK